MSVQMAIELDIFRDLNFLLSLALAMRLWDSDKHSLKRFGSLCTGFPKRKIILVNSRHGEDLPEAFQGLSLFLYDPRDRPPFWCVRFWFTRIFLCRQAPRQVQTLISIAKSVGAQSIVASDAYSALLDAEKHLPGVKMYWIQHGLYLNQGASILRREKDFASKTTSITLLTISDYDVSNYARWGVDSCTKIPVGSLKNGIYVKRRLAMVHPPSQPRFNICLVEKGYKLNPESEYSQGYRDNWDAFLPIFAQYLNLRRPRLIVAFSQSSERQLVADLFREKLGYDFVGTDERDEFATYASSDSAELTIGIASTVLAESLSRKRKVLSFNCSPHSLWSFPGSSFIRLNSSLDLSLHQLQTKVDEVLAMTWDEYASRTKETLNLFAVDATRTVSSIRSIVLGDEAVQTRE